MLHIRPVSHSHYADADDDSKALYHECYVLCTRLQSFEMMLRRRVRGMNAFAMAEALVLVLHEGSQINLAHLVDLLRRLVASAGIAPSSYSDRHGQKNNNMPCITD